MGKIVYNIIKWLAFIAFILGCIFDLDGWTPIISLICWILIILCNPDMVDGDKPAKPFHTDGFLN